MPRRSGVAERLPSLEGDLQMAFALRIKPFVASRGVKSAPGEILAHLDIAIDIGGFNLLHAGFGLHVRTKMAAAIGMQNERPLRRREFGVGEVLLDYGIGRIRINRSEEHTSEL